MAYNKTRTEALDDLKTLDEITVVETLDLTAEEIVDRCEDLVDEHWDTILLLLEDEFGTDEEEELE
jgi:hypothetical protein